MKIQFEFQDGDAKAISFFTALLSAMKAEQQLEQHHEEQAIGKQNPESRNEDSSSQESSSQEVVESPAATKDAAFAALRTYISQNGGEAAKSLLGEFGVARFGELDEAHYGALIARIGAP
jgi:hypothetical protein